MASELIELPELHLEILKLAWSAWNDARSNTAVNGGVIREEVFQRLKGKLRTRWKSPQKGRQPSDMGDEATPPAPSLVSKSDTLKGHLKTLCSGPFNRLVSKRTADYPGAPFVYMINDHTVATYASSAFLLVHLFGTRHMERRDLLKAMLAQAQVAFLPSAATREEIINEVEQQIEWCLSRQYLEYVEKHPTELRPTARLQYEYRFLEFVASHPPRTATSAADD